MAASCGVSTPKPPGWCSRNRASSAGGWWCSAPRQLHFSDPAPVQALALLLQSEQELPATSSALRARVAGSSQAAEIDDVIAAILIARFNGRSIQELCAMGGITLDDFTQSVAYREIFGRGEVRGIALGEARGEALGEAKVTMRLLARRCGPLSAEQESLIRSLPLERLEALLDFEGMADLIAWLRANT